MHADTCRTEKKFHQNRNGAVSAQISFHFLALNGSWGGRKKKEKREREKDIFAYLLNYPPHVRFLSLFHSVSLASAPHIFAISFLGHFGKREREARQVTWRTLKLGKAWIKEHTRAISHKNISYKLFAKLNEKMLL